MLGVMWKNGFVGKWLKKRFYFSKATICIQGLVLSHSFVNHAITSILIKYITDNWKHQHFQIAAVVTNVQEGVTEIMVIVLAHISHTYSGSFPIIATTSAASLHGVLLFWLYDKYMDLDTAAIVFYGAMLLLSLGEAGRSAALKEFLHQQFLSQLKNPRERTGEQEGLDFRGNTLWPLPWVLGTVISVFRLKATWVWTFMISTFAMGVTYVAFLFGFSSYAFIDNKESIVFELEDCIEEEENQENELLVFAKEAQNQENNIIKQKDGGKEPCQASGSLSLRLDKILAGGGGKFWALIKKLIKEKKLLVKEMLTTWFAYLWSSVVMAAGSTFFFEQLSNLDSPFTGSDPEVIFYFIRSISKSLSRTSPKKWKSSSATTRVRIGCGMACSMLCCFAAWQVEIQRMKNLWRVGVGDHTVKPVSMTIFWLLPQFFLLGLMEGLVGDGLTDLIVHGVDDADDKVLARYYGSHTNDFIIGIGKLITALSILVLRRTWLEDKINLSRLDKYFRALTYLTIATFCYYLCVALYFNTKEDKSEEYDQPLVEVEVSEI